MATQKSILALVACFSLALLGAQPPSPVPRRRFDPRLLRGLSDEQVKQKREQWHRERNEEHSRRVENWMKGAKRQAWKHLLRVNEHQWTVIEPIVDRFQVLGDASWVGAAAWGSRQKESFHCFKHSEGAGPTRPKTPDEMSEGEKIADALIDLLRDPNSTDAQIRQKTDALQQTREKARKGLAELRRELGAVPMTPRQEAIFLIMGYIN